MIVKKSILLMLFGLLILSLGGCGGSDPADAVEAYLQAKVTGDQPVIRALLCSDMEANLERELLTFASVTGAEIRNMTCERVGTTDTVKCNGEIVALYGAEENVFPLTTYRVVEEDGEWKWCGESS